eukprot:15359762-Ditylum_brightwellii.AAC.1
MQNGRFGNAKHRMNGFLYNKSDKHDDGCDKARHCNNSSSNNKPWFPSGFLSKKDKLVIQTTSLGANWTEQDLVRVAQSYMGKRCQERNKSHFDNDSEKESDWINSVDIIWPTMDFIKQVNKRCSFMEQQQQDIGNENASKSKSCVSAAGNSAFLSSTTFNTIDLSCISRMALYDTTGKPNCVPWTLSPHIKTFGRLLRNDDDDEESVSKDDVCYNIKEGQHHHSLRQKKQQKIHRLGWIILTSACLSNGAQGKAVKDRCYDSDEMSYSNFELGVLFCSRIQGVTSTDRIYGWDPDYCNNCCCRDGKIRVSVDDGSSSIEEKVQYHSCSSSSSRVTMQKKKKDVRFIHLPIPYNLEPPMYQEDEDDVD